jgi:protein ImuA
MSHGRRQETVAHLRNAIAGIEAEARPSGPRAPLRLPLARSLDSALGGGLAGDALHEIAPATAGDGAAAMGFALCLAGGFCAASPRRGSVLVASEDFCRRETGALYGPGLAAFGLERERLVILNAPDGRALLWAMEEALKSGALAVVVGELWSLARHYGLAASRRLLLAARAGATPALLVHGGLFGQAAALSSAAETRFEIAAAASRRLAPANGRLNLPGAPAFAARLVKARLSPSAQGPPARLFDETRISRLEWRGDETCFYDPTVPLPVVRSPVDGSRARLAGE